MRFLTGWLRTLAAFMRSAAALLERMSSPQPASAAMTDLAARYPGAPDHWLQYIAAHAPLFPEAEDQKPFLQPSPNKNDRRDQSEPVPSLKKAPLNFASSEKSRKPSAFKFFGNQARQQVAKISFPDRNAKSPPRPHFVRADGGRVKTAPLRLQPDVANDVRPPAANANDEIAAAVTSAQKSNLRLIRNEGTRTPNEEHTTQPMEKEAGEIRWTQNSPIARLVRLIGLGETPAQDIQNDIEWCNDLPVKREVALQAPPLKRPTESAVMSAERPAPHTSSAELFTAPAAEQLPRALEFPQQTSRIPGEPYFGPAKPPAINPKFPVEHFDRRWPALPPVVEPIHDAPIEPPRLSRLAREQEDGLWNA